jgi:multidrug efflux pump subunit AcrA (membrane-fusion protein)
MNKHKFTFRYLFFAGFTIAIGLVNISCSKDGDGAQALQKKPPLVSVAEAKAGTIARKAELPGSVRPDVTANVLAPAEGRITSFNYREGDFVQKNAIIAKISPTIREDILNAARLKESDAGNLDFAERQYQEIAVVAPIGGVISMRNAETGDIVIQRQKLVEIQNSANIHVEVPVPEREMPRIKKGMETEIRPDALPGKVFEGKVTRIYPTLDERTRTGTVEVSLPNSASESLKTGMFARVSFILEKSSNAVLVPTDAVVLSEKGETVVFVVNDGKVASQKVKIGIETGGTTQIIEGISSGDTVVRAGNENLKDGAQVRVMGAPGGGEKKSGEK